MYENWALKALLHGVFFMTTLLASLVFYSTMAALFLGIFVIRYHLELILSAPM